jgi:hypothetical protein
MVTITCDICEAVKPQPEELKNEEWILGYDLESESLSAVSRTVRFLDRWDSRRALELGAIHLCSEECREKYLTKARAA